MEHKGRFILIIGLLIVAIGISCAGTTFSYINAVINPNSSNSSSLQNSSSNVPVLGFNWIDGVNINAGLVNPGDLIVEKTFEVDGTLLDSVQKNYEIDLDIKNNTYADNALIYTISSTNESSNGVTIQSNTLSSALHISGKNTVIIGTGSFSGPVENAKHTYVLRIYRDSADTTQYGSATFEASLDGIFG